MVRGEGNPNLTSRPPGPFDLRPSTISLPIMSSKAPRNGCGGDRWSFTRRFAYVRSGWSDSWEGVGAGRTARVERWWVSMLVGGRRVRVRRRFNRHQMLGAFISHLSTYDDRGLGLTTNNLPCSHSSLSVAFGFSTSQD